MPFAFTLPTTSSLSYPSFATSSTHPSLPVTATTCRQVLKSVLKNHKRLAAKAKAANHGIVLSALNEYVPYILALDAGLNGKRIHGEDVDLTLRKEIEVEWRSSLSESVPGRDWTRVKGKGLDYELAFTLHTLACLCTLQARSQLLTLYGAVTPTEEQRVNIVTTATKHLLRANSIHNYLNTSLEIFSGPVETLDQTQGGLAALALAEATLLAVLKDDPYPAVVAQDRNKNDKEWMIKAPEIPKVRAHLFARLCMRGAEHAATAEAMLSGSSKVNDQLLNYVTDLRKTSRAKACRFFGIDAELGGETGQAIAWLVGGKKQLGFAGKEDGSGLKRLAKFKREWTEKREDRKVEKGGEWGSDAGRLEELRVIEMLEQKWNKMNDTINTQLIPPSDPLVASMPSGRDMYTVQTFQAPTLDEGELAQLRAPPDRESLNRMDENSSDDENEKPRPSDVPGAFPGSPAKASQEASYY